MTYDEVKNSIISAMKNPDSMETEMMALLDNIKADYEGLVSIEDELAKAQVRIRDLQDTNHKLFLAQTASVEEDPEEVEKPTGVGVIDEFKELVNSLDVKE